MLCKYLEGENIKPTTAAEARLLIGKDVTYLCKSDIDKSGRGYFFPKTGTIVDVSGRNIAIDHKHNFVIYITDLVEMILNKQSVQD